MKVAFRRREGIFSIGFWVLLLFFILHPFHFILTEQYVYYREVFFCIFFILAVPYVLNLFTGRQRDFVPHEIWGLLLFLCMLVGFSLLDPGVNLYQQDYYEASQHLSERNLNLYILRNAVLYVPMVLYLALRGLSEGEIKLLAMVLAIVAPFSINSFLQNRELIASINEIGAVVEYGGEGLEYNSYVPYLTFPTVSALYLAAILKNKLLRFFFLMTFIGLSFYILASTSRQSLIFVFLAAAIFFLLPRGKVRLIVLLAVIAGAVFGAVALSKITAQYVIADKLVQRYGSLSGLVETPRFEIAMEGLRLLKPHEFLTGAGLSSVVVSGPHTDYIRWIQRIGVFGMLLSFLPFFIAFSRSYRCAQEERSRLTYVFCFLAVSFVLYHSLFGYPREDAYQAPYAFLGLGLWLGYSKYERASSRARRVNDFGFGSRADLVVAGQNGEASWRGF